MLSFTLRSLRNPQRQGRDNDSCLHDPLRVLAGKHAQQRPVLNSALNNAEEFLRAGKSMEAKDLAADCVYRSLTRRRACRVCCWPGARSTAELETLLVSMQSI